MKKLFLITLVLIILTYNARGQESALVIDGTLEFSNTNETIPEPGTLRWTGFDFEGWTGEAWYSLTLHTKVGTVIDIDSNEYRTVFIGYREWMVENLRTTKYRNGAPIELATHGNSWINNYSGAYCFYDNDDSHNQLYGKLYNWYAVAANEGLCPDGWEVPDQVDWAVLADALGGVLEAGGEMKQKGTENWNSPNQDATNSSGFSGLPGGFRVGSTGGFASIMNKGYFWSRDAVDATQAYYHILWNSLASLSSGQANKRYGSSIRCIRK